MPKKPPPGYPHLPGGGPGPGTGKPGPKPPPSTGPATLATTQPSLQGGGSSGGGGAGGGAPDSNPELLTRGTGPIPEWIMRDFTAGMHVNPQRDAIAEQDLWWCENLQPLASGNLVPVFTPGNNLTPPLPPGGGEGGRPYYVTQVSVSGSQKVFVAYPSGSAYLFDPFTGTATKIMTNLLYTAVPQTYVVNWTGNGPANTGFLIIDPNGYWDYNLTAANTLTSLSGGISSGTNTTKNTVAGGTPLKQVSTGTGTGTVLQAHYQVISASINAAGTGYNLGDILSLTDNNPVTAAQITVTQLGAGNSIAAIQLTIAGDYPGPTSGALVNTGPSGNTVTGGGGTGATFHITIQAFKLVVVSAGSGWTGSPPTMTDETGTPTVIDKWNLTIGVTSGTSIATYAGRVWIGNGNTLSYTDINSYNSFANAGGISTFSDQYLQQGITCLYAANNYLYMFGVVSVDVISNVQVSTQTGLTTFSRVNVLLGVGVNYPAVMTVIGFQRGIAFLDISGLYLLAGATPERLSERIQGCIRVADLTGSGGAGLRPSCGLATVNDELCLMLQVSLVPDCFSQGPLLNNRVVIFMYQRHRWWVHTTYFGNQNNVGPITGSPVFQNYGSFGLVPTGISTWQLQRLLTPPGVSSSPIGPWQLRTKLWDGAAAFREKQGLNAAIQCVWVSPGPLQATGVTFTVDSELKTSASITVPPVPTLFVGNQQSTGTNNGNYALQVVKGFGGATQAWGSQYIGLTFIGDGTQVNVIEGLALRGKQENNKLE